MEPDGDITEAFDDGELAKSIEAGQQGPWNDQSAVFEDPKIETLKKAITTPEQADYKQRRLLEMQQRGANGKLSANKQVGASKAIAKSAPAAAPPAQAPWGDPVPVWNEHGTVMESQWNDRRSPANAPDAEGPGGNVVQARRASDRVETIEAAGDLAEEKLPTRIAQSLVVSYVPSILAAILVFSAATVVHGLFVGWQLDLLLRAGAAMAITGIGWCRFQAGRLRAMTIATIAYGALFVPSDRLGDPENVFAVFLGLLIVVAGAGLIGVQRDEFGTERL